MTTNLIIGGTGKTGRRVVSRLQDRYLPVTAEVLDEAAAS